jgi:hypothetical protein
LKPTQTSASPPTQSQTGAQRTTPSAHADARATGVRRLGVFSPELGRGAEAGCRERRAGSAQKCMDAFLSSGPVRTPRAPGHRTPPSRRKKKRRPTKSSAFRS